MWEAKPPFSLSSSSEPFEGKMFCTFRRFTSIFDWMVLLWFLAPAALPQYEGKHIKAKLVTQKMNQENSRKPSLVTGKTTPGCEKKNPSWSFKPETFVGNLKLKFIWKGLTGKTVVEVRCCGARRDCMWLMHRFKGNFSLEGARDLRIVTLFYTFFYSFSSSSFPSFSSWQ